MKYTCTKFSSSVQVKFSIDDIYNFDRIRTISGDVEKIVQFHFGDFGNLANDAGLISQADRVISVYHCSIRFEKTVEMKGVFL